MAGDGMRCGAPGTLKATPMAVLAKPKANIRSCSAMLDKRLMQRQRPTLQTMANLACSVPSTNQMAVAR